MDEKVDASISEIGSANACFVGWLIENGWLRGYKSPCNFGCVRNALVRMNCVRLAIIL